MKLEIRNGFFKPASQACGKRFPEQVQHYQNIYAMWVKERAASLNQAEQLVMLRNSRDDADEMSRLVDAEKIALKEWQVQKLGISMQQPPTTADCEKILKNLSMLP